MEKVEVAKETAEGYQSPPEGWTCYKCNFFKNIYGECHKCFGGSHFKEKEEVEEIATMTITIPPSKHGNNSHTTPTQESEHGIRFNFGKLPMDLIPPDALIELAKVYKFGIEKGYPARNWEKGLSFRETYAALQRHAIAWLLKDDIDEESGINHLAHVAWNAFALLTYQLRGMDSLDDR